MAHVATIDATYAGAATVPPTYTSFANLVAGNQVGGAPVVPGSGTVYVKNTAVYVEGPVNITVGWDFRPDPSNVGTVTINVSGSGANHGFTLAASYASFYGGLAKGFHFIGGTSGKAAVATTGNWTSVDDCTFEGFGGSAVSLAASGSPAGTQCNRCWAKSTVSTGYAFTSGAGSGSISACISIDCGASSPHGGGFLIGAAYRAYNCSVSRANTNANSRGFYLQNVAHAYNCWAYNCTRSFVGASAINTYGHNCVSTGAVTADYTTFGGWLGEPNYIAYDLGCTAGQLAAAGIVSGDQVQEANAYLVFDMHCTVGQLAAAGIVTGNAVQEATGKWSGTATFVVGDFCRVTVAPTATPPTAADLFGKVAPYNQVSAVSAVGVPRWSGPVSVLGDQCQVLVTTSATKPAVGNLFGKSAPYNQVTVASVAGADLGLVNPAANDYTTVLGSLLIDRGCASAPPMDYFGTVIPAGAAPDVGFYETPLTPFNVYVNTPRVVRQNVDDTTGFSVGDIVRGFAPLVFGEPQGPNYVCRVMWVDAPDDDLYLQPLSKDASGNFIEPADGDTLTNDVGTATCSGAPTLVQDPEGVGPWAPPQAVDTFVGVTSVGAVVSVPVIDGQYPRSDYGLIDDDFEPFHLPVDDFDSYVVEFAGVAPALELDEPVVFNGYQARVRAVGAYYVVLYDATGAPLAGDTIRTIRGMQLVGGVLVLMAEDEFDVQEVWDENEYCVPSIDPGLYTWDDVLIQTDYALRVYYTDGGAAFPIAIGDHLVDDVDPAHATPRGRWEAVSAGAAAAAPWPAGTRYVDVVPIAGYPRSQPYMVDGNHTGDLQIYTGGTIASGNSITVSNDADAREWVPGGTANTEDTAGRSLLWGSDRVKDRPEKIG